MTEVYHIGAQFTTFTFYFHRISMAENQMNDEGRSLYSLSVYSQIRTAACMTCGRAYHRAADRLARNRGCIAAALHLGEDFTNTFGIQVN